MISSPEQLSAGARRLARGVMAAAPESLDVTPMVGRPSLARFGPAEVPSGARRVLVIDSDWSARVGNGALRWTIYDLAGEPTDSSLVGDDAVAVIIAAMERAMR